MQDDYVDIQHKSHVKIIILHVNIAVLHVDINESHVRKLISMLT